MTYGKYLRMISATAVVAVAGCSAREVPADAAANADTGATVGSATAVNVVTVSATDYEFAAPDQIPAGLTTFKLVDNGKEVHHASLIRLKDGKTHADLVAAMKAMKPGTQPPDWMEPLGGPNAVVPGGASNATVMLEPGNYALVCFVPDAKMVPHFVLGMTRGFTVTAAAASAAPAPTPDITVSLSDYKFEWSTPLTAGRHVIKVETAAGQPHELTLFQIPPGKTLKDLEAWLKTMSGPPPAMPVGGVSGLVAGKPNYIEVDLKPGDYAAVCFLEDAKDGKPHFLHGMTQAIKVS